MSPDRIDGWKAIGLHFGRNRSTVIRWARQRAMPVHAMPGGKIRTVYALRSELDAWASHSGLETATTSESSLLPSAIEFISADDIGDSSVRANFPVRRRRWGWIGAGAAVVAAAAFGVGHVASREARTMPRGADARALYLEARDDWAARNSASLARSIDELQQVNRLDPKFAPAFADLANAYLLAQEAGSMSDQLAFDRAQAAAAKARSLDPNLAAAYRALGFVAYWRDGDRAETGRMFDQALSLDDDDAQSHFWYANILADNGQDDAAMREFERARLLDPGSDNIAADLAWANWSAGRTKAALAQLSAIESAHPGNVEAHDCQSIVYLAAGNIRGYLAELDMKARLRNEPELSRAVQALREAATRGGVRAFQQLLLDQSLASQAKSVAPDHAEAAFFASIAGQRSQLLAILKSARQGQEIWGSAGYVRRIAARWRSDAEIIAGLDALRPASIS